MMREKIGSIYSTCDYSIFKKQEGNRGGEEYRGELLLKDIKTRGQLQPIIVNSDMEVIDGQARLWALRSLKMPVQFIVNSNADYDDTIAINTTQKNWKTADYIKSYKERGYPSYQYLYALTQMFPGYSPTIIYNIVAHNTSSGGGLSIIRDGAIKIGVNDYDEAVEKLNYINPLKPFFPAGGTSISNYIIAVSCCLDMDSVSEPRLSHAIRSHQHLMKAAATVGEAIQILDTCYNYKRHSSIHITELYREQVERSKARKANNLMNYGGKL